MTDIAALREHARAIFEAGVEGADPAAAVRESLSLEGETLRVWTGREGLFAVDLSGLGRIILIGAGKASAAMGGAVESLLGERIEGGIVVVRSGYGAALGRARVIEAGHPIPDEAGLKGAEAVLELVEHLGERDLLVSCLSGGGSALLPAPVPGISLEDKRALTELLLDSGANIQEINTIRKHCSLIKGGQLARRAYPAEVIALVLSDVVGNRLDTIASGPLYPDDTTFADCQAVLQRYGLSGLIPPAVRAHLERGLSGEVPDTPKRGEPCFSRVHHQVVADNKKALEAAAKKAGSLGYGPYLLTDSLQGESRQVAKTLVALAGEVQRSGHPVAPPACVLAGGEPTVTVRGPGRGGRCQELALAGAIALEGAENMVLLAAGTDGSDGPTDAAGAVADGTTLARAAGKGLDARGRLEANDSYPFFQELGDLVVTGPTLTNVMDLFCVLVAPL